MNTTPKMYRDVACGTAAALITVALSLAFVQSTSVPPGARPVQNASLTAPRQHVWFGQPEPAVLVD
jgi:hypothetical protein